LNNGFEYPPLGLSVNTEEAHVFALMFSQARFKGGDHLRLSMARDGRATMPRIGFKTTLVGVFCPDL
jgi:hypothetical protein